MSDYLVLAALIAFTLSFFAGSFQKLAALGGWSCVVLNLWSEMPAYLQEHNFLYPVLAILSLPFLVITGELLLHEDPYVVQLSRTAAFAAIIFVPFALVPLLRDGLVSIVISHAFTLITALGHHPVMLAWDIMAENGFANQIILGCTGILAIAMMLGVAFGDRNLNRHQALFSFILIVPVIAALNLIRVAVVFIAVSDHWFSAFPDPTGTGDANFFWAHNVFAEGSAIVVLLLLVYGLSRINPELPEFCRSLAGVFRDRVRQLVPSDIGIKNFR